MFCSLSLFVSPDYRKRSQPPESQTKQSRAPAPTKRRRAAWRCEVRSGAARWATHRAGFFFFFFFPDLAGFLLGCRGGLQWLVGWFEVGHGGAVWSGLAVGRGFGLRGGSLSLYQSLPLPQPIFFSVFFFSIGQIYLIFRCCRWVI